LELLEKSKIASKAHLKVQHFSDGKQPRVEITKILIINPRIISAD
jgi:ABC-type phosphate/phosphonate transport system ATPase subunit